MGLGLSALTALVLLLPGFAFVLGVSRLWGPSRKPTPFEQHFSAGVLIAIASAVLLHGIGLQVAEWTAALGLTLRPRPDFALVLLAGDLKAPLAAQALGALAHSWFAFVLHLGWLSVLGFEGGRILNRWMPRPPGAEWASLLEMPPEFDRDSGFAVLTTEVVHGDATWLYSGYLSDFATDREGKLERVVLRGYAARRLLRDEEIAERLDDPTFEPPTRWIEIPGEIFVLQMAGARTINVDFFFDVDDDETVERIEDVTGPKPNAND